MTGVLALFARCEQGERKKKKGVREVGVGRGGETGRVRNLLTTPPPPTVPLRNPVIEGSS